MSNTIKNVRSYVFSTVTSKFGEKQIAAGNPFACAMDRALDKKVKAVKKSRKG